MVNNEIWITGIGLVTPHGVHCTKNWHAVCAGIPCEKGTFGIPADNKIVYINEELFFDPAVSGMPLNKTEGLRSGLVQHAAQQALDDAKITVLPQAGVIVCCGKPTTGRENQWVKAFSTDRNSYSSVAITTSIKQPALMLARKYGFGGPVLNITAACATGLYAIIAAARIIRSGDANTILTGAVEIAPDDCFLASYHNMKVMTDCFEHFRPFHTHRNGFFIAEGCGMLVVESAKTAQKRGAIPYAIIEDWTTLNDPSGMTIMNEDGAVIAEILTRLVAKNAKKIDYINTHGTGTPLNDRAEMRSISRVFGTHSNIVCSATKPLTGHMFSATAAIEVILTALSLSHQKILPTIRLDLPDAECTLQFTSQTLEASIERAISLSYGFGGSMGGILLRKP